MSWYLLSEDDVRIMKLIIADFRERKKPTQYPKDTLHRASDIVKVKVTEEIPARDPDYDPETDGPVPTHHVDVWDIEKDEEAGYTIPIMEKPDVHVATGDYYAAIDRHGVWSIVSSGSDILIKTPEGGIPACTGSGPYTFGSATCLLVEAINETTGEVTETEVTIKNIVDQAIAGSVLGKASRVGPIWVIDVASCGSS